MAVPDQTFAPPALTLGTQTVLRGPDVTRAPAAGQGLALTPTGIVPPEANSRILYYEERTSDKSITHTTEATADSVIAGADLTYDGRPLLFQFYFPAWNNNNTLRTITIVLQDGSSVIAQIYFDGAGAITTDTRGNSAWYRYTSPGAGPHTFNITCFGSNNTNITLRGGTSGSGAYGPMFLRISRDD